MLEISLNFSLNISYKQDRFSEILLKKGFEFILSHKNNTVVFNLSLIFLLAKVDLIFYKKKLQKTLL